MDFRSDNVTGASAPVIAALQRLAVGALSPYGNDDLTRAVEKRLEDLFECPLKAYLVATGSAANALALSVLCPPYGALYCHPDAHIATDECGAPEFYTGGAKLVTIPGDHGKITAAGLEAALAKGWQGVVHHVQPAAVSLTQASEAGTVYKPREIAAIARVARRHGLALHMDGARFANALVGLGCTPAEATWKAGVDVLSFGGTKNGCLAVEAVLFFQPERARDFEFRRKRGGHLFSKMRFLAAQMQAYLEDDLWLENARHANRLARRLAAGLKAIPGIRRRHQVEANEVFLDLPGRLAKALAREGFIMELWAKGEPMQVRLVTAFSTKDEEVDAFLAAARRLQRA
ncbi:MAG: low specificity L-threonine aldolase [Proteobacteria bacterium]|nr:low specificity L-threonine aldolase [Pseudomonadota bacterium]